MVKEEDNYCFGHCVYTSGRRGEKAVALHYAFEAVGLLTLVKDMVGREGWGGWEGREGWGGGMEEGRREF